MGELNLHNLASYGCSIFIETGTGQGTGTEYACQSPFKEIHTIEIIPELHAFSKAKIQDPRIFFHLGNSIDVFKEILPAIPKTEKILFWMDAHFPGEDFGLGKGFYTFDDDNMPLNQELKVIYECRKGSQDSFIIDDLRLYENGNYQLGDFDIGKPKSGIGFIEDLFKDTHSISRDYRHQGFIILRPKA